MRPATTDGSATARAALAAAGGGPMSEPYDPETHASAWVIPPTGETQSEQLAISEGDPDYWRVHGEDTTVIWWPKEEGSADGD